MLAWLILFTFLTGMFAGSTLLFGAAIILTQRNAQNRKTTENLEQHEKEYVDEHVTDGNILQYR